MKRLLLTLFLFSTNAAALEINQQNAMVINGIIGPRTVNDVVKALETAKNNVDLVINSYGGSLMSGFEVINRIEALKNRGVPVRCFVIDKAMSAAALILDHCSERYALNTSLLMWHGGAITAGEQPLKEKELRALYLELQEYNQSFIDYTAAVMHKTIQEVAEFNLLERVMQASKVEEMAPRYISTQPAISGLFEALNNPKLPGNKKQELDLSSLFGGEEGPATELPIINNEK